MALQAIGLGFKSPYLQSRMIFDNSREGKIEKRTRGPSIWHRKDCRERSCTEAGLRVDVRQERMSRGSRDRDGKIWSSEKGSMVDA